MLDRFAGVLFGTAIGDALGLPMEGMHAKAIARRFPEIDRYSLLGERGFVSDDTEQTALVAQSLCRHPRDVDAFVRAFRWSLLGWFARLPWGIGLATLRACLRIALGFRRTGVASAGNGAAMRAAVVGAFFFDDAAARRSWSDALARITHTDARAVEGARFVAEVSGRAVAARSSDSRAVLLRDSLSVVEEHELRAAVTLAMDLAENESPLEVAAERLGNTGFVVHTTALATFCFARYGHRPIEAIVQTIRAGGDTDSNAAIVGAWAGALHGESGLPHHLVSKLQVTGLASRPHLRALALDLERARRGHPSTKAHYFWPTTMLRNLVLYPVVLIHAVRVLAVR